MELVFLGTGAGCGVPSFFCDCVACQEARAEPRFQRSRCGLLLRGAETTLVDAPPELRQDLLREGAADVDRMILTHWHFDHFGGLGDLEFYVRLRRKQRLPVAMTGETQAQLLAAFDFLADCLEITPVVAGATWEFDGLSCTFLEAGHAPGTLGLLFEREGRRTAYFPDTGPLPPATAAALQRVDTLIVDATFWGRNWMPASHQSVEGALALARSLGTGRVYLTHLSMHHDQPVSNRELEAYLRNQGEQFNLAYDGLRITL